jgi:hypothetical protein
VNDTFALGLPPALNASYKTTSRSGSVIDGENSTFALTAKAEANNSQVVCAVGINNEIAERSEPAILIITGKILILQSAHA